MSIRKKVIITGLYLLLLLSVTSVSVWLFIPAARNKVLEEYSVRFNPIIPRSEFRMNPHAIKRNEDGSYSYVSNNRHITVKGMTTTVVMPDGTVETRYMGKVTKVPKETWEDFIGATESANINTSGQALDIENRRIAISHRGEFKILQLSRSTLIERTNRTYDSKGKLTTFSKSQSSMSDIKEGNFILYSGRGDLDRLTILTPE